MDANITTIIVAVIAGVSGIITAYISKKQPSPPNVQKGLELAAKWRAITDSAHSKAGSLISALWAFSNGKRYYGGSHAQVMNMIAYKVPEGVTVDSLQYQNIPIEHMERYLRDLRPGEVKYFDENEAPNHPIARDHISHGINTVCVYPVFQKRRFFARFRDKILIQVLVFKFQGINHRLTRDQLTDIQLTAFQLERLKE